MQHWTEMIKCLTCASQLADRVEEFPVRSECWRYLGDLVVAKGDADDSF